jgi:hypothetical protein
VYGKAGRLAGGREVVEAIGCPRCRRPVPADAPSGGCPACLLLLGLADTPDGGREGTVAVTVAVAAVWASGTVTADPDATLNAGAARPEWLTDSAPGPPDLARRNANLVSADFGSGADQI